MRFRTSCWWLALCFLVVWPAVAPAQPVQPRPADGLPPRAPSAGLDAADAAQASALETLRKTSTDQFAATFENGQPEILRGAFPVSGTSLADQGRNFIGRFAEELWRLGPNSDLVLQRTDPATGLASFRQRYRGLPVIGGELNLIIADGSVRTALGTLLDGDGLATIPTLAEQQARDAAVGRQGFALAPRSWRSASSHLGPPAPAPSPRPTRSGRSCGSFR